MARRPPGLAPAWSAISTCNPVAAVSALRQLVAGLIGLLLALAAWAEAPCRIAFDLGSSGIRAGASEQSATARRDIDYLGPLWAGRSLAETIGPTIFALRDLPAEAGFGRDCLRIAGGFSAWRLQAEQDAELLATLLGRIQLASSVAVLVIPQNSEGRYGYFGAQQRLGAQLTTSHILDIGGGSLQIAGQERSFGTALGQQAWRRLLCQTLRDNAAADCPLQPLSQAELASAAELLKQKLAGLADTLGDAVSLTAISRPVTQGIMPAVTKLQGLSADASLLPRPALQASIAILSEWSLAETSQRLGIPEKFAAYLLSDMLLVDGLLQATGADHLAVAELSLTNLPGLLADERALAWAQHYDCYLQRLRQSGIAAFDSDPATCPRP